MSLAAPPRVPTQADQTRLALIRAALHLFGRNGFEATSTREIASRAKANVGSIAYHFGGKEGLRDACAQHVVATIRALAGGVLDARPPALPADRAAAEALLTTMAERMIAILVGRPEAGEFVQFILREMTQPSPALDIIYTGLVEPVHMRLCRIWEAATGEPAESERTRISVFTMIGQVIYFRIAREAVTRRMGWSQIGPAEVAAVTAVAADNLRAVLCARREKSG